MVDETGENAADLGREPGGERRRDSKEAGDASATARSYDEIAEAADVAIREAKRKVESGRVYDESAEKVRVKWIRALVYAVSVRRQVENDATLSALSERVAALEEAERR